jgi:hypothetical protein
LQYDKQPGALSVAGAITNKQEGFSSTMRFVDAAAQHSTKLYGAHLLVGKPGAQSGMPESASFTPRVTVRNTTSQPVQLQSRVLYTTEDASSTVEIAPVTLSANEVKELDMSAVIASVGLRILTDSGIELEHSGNPGAIVAAIASVDQSKSQVFDVPLRDPKSPSFGGGSYPWRIDGNNRAVVHLKNIDPLTDGEPRQALVTLYYEGGSYTLPVQLVEAGQTLAIDIKRLRDEQVEDSSGNVIPSDVTRGQVRWSGRGTHGDFIGRLAQYDPVAGTASSFSCATPCVCNRFYVPLTSLVTVTPPNGFTGTVAALKATETDKDCQGNLYPNVDVTDITTFSSSNPSVVQVIGRTALFDNAGTAKITGAWDVTTGAIEDNCPPLEEGGKCGPATCAYNDGWTEDSANVVVKPRVTISGSQTIMDGETAQFSVTVQGANPTGYQWTYSAPSGAGNNPNVTFNPGNQAQTTTDGHWFAYPNRDCPITNAISTYTIKCTVSFSSGNPVTVQTTLRINGLWNPAGETDPRTAGITGSPAMAPDANGVWHITGIGGMRRRLPTKVVHVPNTSQFYTKTDAHEQEHAYTQWLPGNLFGNTYIVADFYQRIRNFTGTSQVNLQNQVAAEFQLYTNAQDAFINSNIAQSERLAYQVSDAIAPQYLYQNCGRY